MCNCHRPLKKQRGSRHRWGPLARQNQGWYVERYMRSGSHTRYPNGVIRHTTTFVDADPHAGWLKLRCNLDDEFIIEHKITAGRDVVEFAVTASDQTSQSSDVAWGAACIIVDEFTGNDNYS